VKSEQWYKYSWANRSSSAASRRGEVRVWEIGHSRLATCVQTLEAHTHWVSGLAFAPDGSRLASASRRGWLAEKARRVHGVPRRLAASLRAGVLTDGEDLAQAWGFCQPGEVMGSEMPGAGD